MNVARIESHLGQRPGSPVAVRLADEYLKLNRVEEAIHLCMDSIGRYSAYGTAHLVLAKCLVQKKEYKLALGHLKEAANYFPNSPTINSYRTLWEQKVSAELQAETNVEQRAIRVEKIAAPRHVQLPIVELPPLQLEHIVEKARGTGLVQSVERVVVDNQDEEEEYSEAPDDGRIISKTLAEIYAVQGAFGEAIQTYRFLKDQRPHLSVEIDNRIRELETKLPTKAMPKSR